MRRLRTTGTLAVVLAVIASSGAFARDAVDARNPAAGVAQRIGELLEQWDVEGAHAELERLHALMPQGTEPLNYFSGRVAFEQGRYDEAIRLLTEAGLEDKPGSYLGLAKSTKDVVASHKTVESDHFILTYPDGKDAILAPYALEALEKIRAAMEKDLGYAPPGKVRVEVVNDARELARVSTLTYEQIRTTGTIAICKFNKLMVTSPKAVLTGYDWLDTLAHEYIHLVVSRKSRNSVPIWLHEGIAKYLESRWRGEAGLALTPSAQALLGRRVQADTLIPFEKMHPSIALLPSAEDAATAFAEVYYAIDFIHDRHGPRALRDIIDALREGQSDRDAVAKAMGMTFPAFEKAWLSHVKSQPFPRELLPLEDKVVLKEEAKGKAEKEEGKKGKEISFGDFAEISEVPARKFAHLGELLRERNRPKAAAREYAKAHDMVGDKYDKLSNKYALALLEIGELDTAQKVLEGSLRLHPGIAATNVHLGRIQLARGAWAEAKAAYREALASNPFDPEIHVALTHVHAQLGENELATRTKSAAALLTGLPEDRIPEIAARMARSKQLVGNDVPTAADDADAGTER